MLPTLTQLQNEMIVYFGFDYPVPAHYQACMQFMAYRFADQWREREKQKRIGGKPLYESERAANESRTYENVAVGKYGEMFASLCMFMFGYPDVAPDFEVYPAGQKDFSADLKYRQRDPDLVDVHVKTCDDFAASYLERERGVRDYSWLFHKSDKQKSGSDPLLWRHGQGKDLIVLAYTHSIDARRIQLLATAPWRLVRPLLVEPQREKLKDIKWALDFSRVSDNATLYMARG